MVLTQRNQDMFPCVSGTSEWWNCVWYGACVTCAHWWPGVRYPALDLDTDQCRTNVTGEKCLLERGQVMISVGSGMSWCPTIHQSDTHLEVETCCFHWHKHGIKDWDFLQRDFYNIEHLLGPQTPVALDQMKTV